MMKILVTGGAGFIGSHIVEHFQGKADVVVFDNLSTGRLSNLKSLNYEFIEGDISDPAVVEKAMQGVDYVFHLAAFVSVPDSIKDPDVCNKINITGTENILKSAVKNFVKKIMFSGSCAVYGDEPSLPKTEASPLEPMSPYAESKLAAEKLCLEYAKKFDIKACCFRYFNVYGPRQDPKSPYAAVIPLFIDAAFNSRPLVIFGDGKQTRDFIFVKDVIQANILGMEKLEGIFNVGTGEEISVLDLATKIIDLSKSKSKINFQPAREGDILRSYSNPSKLISKGFEAKYDIDSGLSVSVGYMRVGR